MASFSTVIPRGKQKRSEYKQTIVLKRIFFLIKSIPRKLTKLLLSPGENNKTKNSQRNLIKSRSKCSLGNTKAVRV